MKKKKLKLEKVFKKYERFFYAGFVALGLITYLLMPGCGGSKNNANNNPIYPTTCIPGQICNGYPGGGVAQGIPLLNGSTYSALDQQGSQLVLSWGASQYAAGQAYNGPVNVSGTLRLAAGVCPGLPQGGDLQVTGQGNWVSGYAGAIAAVQAQLQVVGGGYAQNQYIPYGNNPYGTGYNPYQQTQYNPYGYQQTGGTVSVSQSLIYQGGGQAAYSLSYGYGVYVSMCNRTFAFYN